jgi:hypothetical protein
MKIKDECLSNVQLFTEISYLVMLPEGPGCLIGQLSVADSKGGGLDRIGKGRLPVARHILLQ